MTRVASRISPEVVAALLSAAVILAVIGVRPQSGTPSEPLESIPPSVRPTASELLSPLVRSALETVIVINARLAGSGADLEQELARANPDASRIKVVLPRIAAQVAAVGQPVAVLIADASTADLGADLAKAYESLGDLVRQALRESIQNRPAYLEAGAAGAILIRKLEPLTARAKALLAGRLASANPVPASANPAPSGSAPASSTPIRPPSTGSVTPSSTEGGLVVNGGFEAGVSPWVLQVVPPAAATLDQDRTAPGAGTAAARIQIAAGADARSGISLVQSGAPLRAGQTYTVRLLARAAEARDVRVRLAGTNGDAYVARIFPVGTTWTTISFTFDALVDDPAAEIGIDLGRSVATTWIDGVTLTASG